MSKKALTRVDELLGRPGNFLSDSAPGSPVVISSRVRLARNIRNFNFPAAVRNEDAAVVAKAVISAIKDTGALGEVWGAFFIDGLEELDRQILYERHLISRELMDSDDMSAVCVAADEVLSVMINEEDHLRMQAVLPGLQLQQAWQLADRLDDQLSGSLDMSYDEKLGYLTACPSNLGTGLRASVMLHLPALVQEKAIRKLESSLDKLGMTIRGMYGEGSEAWGNFYQISNQSTLGESEAEILERLGKVVDEIVNNEETARNRLFAKKRMQLLDLVGRSFGVLRYGYVLSGKEAFERLSGLRLGVDMNMFSSLDIRTVNRIFMATAPAHLKKTAGDQILLDEDEEIVRAELVRSMLKIAGAK